MTGPEPRGGFRDQPREFVDAPVRVTGRLPEALAGTLYRNAPTGYVWPRGRFGHWFDGHAQVHAIRLGPDGCRHTCRLVETAALAYARRSGRAPGNFGTGAPGGLWGVATGRIRSTASTHVVALGDQLLALQEGGRPVALGPDLRTLGPVDAAFGPARDQYAAHPRRHPSSGHWHAASLQYGGPRSQTRCLVTAHDAAGRPAGRFSLAMPYRPTIVHDFALTETRVAVPVFPQLTPPWRVALGGSMAYDSAWHPEKGAWLLVSDRDGGSRRRVPLPPMFAFHVVNAHDATDAMVVDVVAYDSGETVKATGRLLTAPPDPVMTASLRRIVVPALGPVTVTTLADGPLEFPQIDPRRAGRRHRYAYAVAAAGPRPADVGGLYAQLVRHDADTGETARWRSPSGHVVGEPVVVPMAGAGPEDAVWLLSVIYDPALHQSRVAVLDGRDLAAGPVAEVHLGVHVPLGFHGSFVGAGA